MKKLIYLIVLIVAISLIVAGCTTSVAPPTEQNELDKAKPEKIECITIQSGLLINSAGEVITTGYDEWGYNYQAHIFNGFYDNVSRPQEPLTEGVNLIMKWNDAWLSNKDCDDDGKLDRHYGLASYIGSGAWVTNHMWGEYEGDGKICKWNWFTKIVAVPEDADLSEGIWYTADGVEIGPVIWGQFATIQSVYNDPCGGYHGIEYLSPSGPGLGKWED